ncbi:class I SAM-dependent methyltransferase family protein [archaeon]|nr:MAG: class I SAM-dependent methyltransferase family protein [archaeon]
MPLSVISFSSCNPNPINVNMQIPFILAYDKNDMKEKKLKRMVKGYIYLDRIKRLPSSYDMVGHIAIIEVPHELQKEKRTIAKALMETNKKIETVLEKKSERTGEYRIRKHILLAGKRKTETVHKEYGCTFKVDPTKVYFSPRELTERQRIAEQVKPRETVMVMFSGVAPYAIQIAKKQPKVKKVIAIEINPIGHKYALENIRINKVSDKVTPILGDVNDVCKPWFRKCSRVLMPLPTESHNFLEIAAKCARKGGIIHYYTVNRDAEDFTGLKATIRQILKGKRNYRIVKIRKVLPYAPRRWKVCVDMKMV